MTPKWKPIPESQVPSDILARLENAIPYTHHGHRFCEAVSTTKGSTYVYRLNLSTGKHSRIRVLEP